MMAVQCANKNGQTDLGRSYYRTALRVHFCSCIERHERCIQNFDQKTLRYRPEDLPVNGKVIIDGS